jgi:PPOX class probable F420-dependent enzyme
VGVNLSEGARRLVAQPLLAIVGTLRPSGKVQMCPVWFEYRDGHFWLNSARGRAWPANLEREQAATLLILDKEDPHYWAQVEGRLMEATEKGAEEHISRLALRYTGQPFRKLAGGEQRVMFKLEPLRITGEKL